MTQTNNAQEKEIKIVAAYYRTSTGNQEQEGTIKTQQYAVQTYAKERGYTIVREFMDDGWSGTRLDRPSLDDLRLEAKKRMWDAIIAYDPDRIARRSAYQEVVAEELSESGVKLLYVTVTAPKTDEEIIMQKMRGVFSEYERMKITERFRIGKVRKARDGHIIASEAPYGYRLIQRKGKPGDQGFVQTHYEIEESEARVVRMIFGWVAKEGLTIRKVVHRLQADGIRPRKSHRGVWNTSTIGTLLRNRTYIGEGHYGSSYAVVPIRPIKTDVYRRIKKSSRRMRPKDEWIMIPVPAILQGAAGVDVFTKAQEQLKTNFEMSVRNKKNEYLLAGLIRCNCGRSRAGEGPQRGRYRYYRCTCRVHSYPLPPACKEKGINAVIADDVVWAEICKLMTSKKLMEAQIRRWMGAKKGSVEANSGDIDRMRKEIAQLKSEEARYMKLYAAQMFEMSQLEEYLDPIRKKISEHEGQMQRMETASQKSEALLLPEATTMETFAAEAKKALQALSFEQKRAIVLSVVDRIVGVPGQLQVYGYVPVEQHVEFKTSHRNRRSPQRGQVHAF